MSQALTIGTIQTLVQSPEPFPVDFDQFWQWCGYGVKATAKELLVRNFKQDVDFVVFRQMPENSQRGRPAESIRLSNKCAKKMAMMARTDKGDEVREYYLKCEVIAVSSKRVDPWEMWRERIELNRAIPNGYFSIFNEITQGLVTPMACSQMPVDDRTVPDVSVGLIWSRYWTENGLDEAYGARVKYPHHYPSSFPQSAANPVEAWIYPDSALPEFRNWLHGTYIPNAFPKYLEGKVKKGALPSGQVETLIETVSRPLLNG